jgi:hypothetical protein
MAGNSGCPLLGIPERNLGVPWEPGLREYLTKLNQKRQTIPALVAFCGPAPHDPPGTHSQFPGNVHTDAVCPVPRPVPFWNVPPRRTGPGPPPYAVDQLPPRPRRRPARLLAHRQQRPLRSPGQASSSQLRGHFRVSAQDPDTAPSETCRLVDVLLMAGAAPRRRNQGRDRPGHQYVVPAGPAAPLAHAHEETRSSPDKSAGRRQPDDRTRNETRTTPRAAA